MCRFHQPQAGQVDDALSDLASRPDALHPASGWHIRDRLARGSDASPASPDRCDQMPWLERIKPIRHRTHSEEPWWSCPRTRVKVLPFRADTGIMGIVYPLHAGARSCREDPRAILEACDAGKWLLIHDSDQVGVFDSFDDAAARAVEEFGVGSYLIRTPGASTVTLPASVVLQRA